MKKKLILIGSNSFVERKIKELIPEDDNIDVRKYNEETFNIEEISDYLYSFPLFEDDKYLIIKNADKIKELTKNQKLFEAPTQAHIILITENKKTLLKKFEHFEILEEEKKDYKSEISIVIDTFRKNGISLSFNEAREIYELCQRNIDFVIKEAEKISTYYHNKSPDSFEELLNHISFSNINNVFGFIDKFFQKDATAAIDKFNKMIENHENLQMAFYMLSKRCMEIYFYKISPQLISGQLYKVSQIKNAAEKWKEEAIENLIKKLYDIDKKVKTSTINLEHELFSLISLIN